MLNYSHKILPSKDVWFTTLDNLQLKSVHIPEFRPFMSINWTDIDHNVRNYLKLLLELCDARNDYKLPGAKSFKCRRPLHIVQDDVDKLLKDCNVVKLAPVRLQYRKTSFCDHRVVKLTLNRPQSRWTNAASTAKPLNERQINRKFVTRTPHWPQSC